MAIFKCKMCGGSLEITDGLRVATCEYCGTKQTIPGADNEKKTNLFNRANRLRIASEFDRASTIYESIVAEYPEEAEAYWGLCLCKYGIEYVDDPKTAEKIPTCHRTSFESIFDDNNYKLTLKHADSAANEVYENEAKVIDALQKDILAIVQREKPFDVFICYKETDDSGKRTQDSVLAQDIYDRLVEKGLKVFFARITLEDKLGQEYEPYIFAALHSAKVMLALGTDPEYFNAVWVKNEWSRFLDLMREDKSKTIIPCYKDMDAYELPGEFKNLQAQDMEKIGFHQDLLRGIQKLLGKTETATQNSSSFSTAETLEKAFRFLSRKAWRQAELCLNSALGVDPECAEVYLGLLMLEKEVSVEEDLAKGNVILEKNKQYQNTLIFADPNLKKRLSAYNESTVYNFAKKKAKGFIIPCLSRAIKEIKKIPEFPGAKQLLKKWKGIVAMQVALILVCVAGFAAFSVIKREQHIRGVYEEAYSFFEQGDYSLAIKLFAEIPEYKDAGQLVEVAKKQQLFQNLLKSGKIEDRIYFGKQYWHVAENDGERLVLISCKTVNKQTMYLSTTPPYARNWENSGVRKWLNEEFLYSNFNEIERSFLVPQGEAKDLVSLPTQKILEPLSYKNVKGEDKQDYFLLPDSDGNIFMPSSGNGLQVVVKTVDVNTRLGIRPVITLDFSVEKTEKIDYLSKQRRK